MITGGYPPWKKTGMANAKNVQWLLFHAQCRPGGFLWILSKSDGRTFLNAYDVLQMEPVLQRPPCSITVEVSERLQHDDWLHWPFAKSMRSNLMQHRPMSSHNCREFIRIANFYKTPCANVHPMQFRFLPLPSFSIIGVIYQNLPSFTIQFPNVSHSWGNGECTCPRTATLWRCAAIATA